MPEPEASPTDLLATPEQLASGSRGKIPADAVGVEDALEAASEAVRNFCGWHIAPLVTEELVIDGSGGRALLIPSMKIVEVLSVVEDGVTLDLSKIEVSASGVLRRSPRWTHRFGGVTVNLRHGWETVPPSVRRLVISIAVRDLMAPTGAVKEQAGKVMIQNSTVAPGVAGGSVLLEHEKAILKRYVIPGRA